MNKALQEKKDLLELAANLPDFAKKHGWVARYDPESDEFSISARKLSHNARIRYADDELAFYVTPTNQIEGIFIEYFQSNFVQHHRDLRKIMKKIKEKDSDLIELKTDKLEQLAPDVEEAIRTILAERLNMDFASA